MRPFLICFTICLSILFTTSFSVAETVHLSIGEWAPYTSEKAPGDKIAETIVKEALKSQGVAVAFSYYPWKRSYVHARKGKSAGTFPWYANPERERDFIIHKEPLMTAQTVFFHLKSNTFQWETFEDLKPYKIGATLGYAEEKILKENGLKPDVISDEKANYKKVHSGRLDATPGVRIAGYRMIKTLFSPDQAALFTHHPKPLTQGRMYMLISRKIPNGQALADNLDAGLKALKASGRYDEIISKALGN